MIDSSDQKTLAFIGVILILRIWLYIQEPLSWILSIAINSLLILFIIVIKHNHVHLSVFRSNTANRMFTHLLNVLSGSTAASMKIIHIVNHHKENNQETDWACTKNYEGKKPFFSFIQYLGDSISTFTKEKKIWVEEHENSTLSRDVKKENYLLLGIYAILLFIDWKATLIVFIVPTIFSQFLLISTNFFQHAYCDPTSEMNSSRNFTGDIFNWFFFNVGYHTAHHQYPERHWSELPTLHREFQDQLQPRLQMNNVWNIYKVIFYGK